MATAATGKELSRHFVGYGVLLLLRFPDNGRLFVCIGLPSDEAQKFHVLKRHCQHFGVCHLVERFCFHIIFLDFAQPFFFLSEYFSIVCDRQHKISAFAATHLESAGGITIAFAKVRELLPRLSQPLQNLLVGWLAREVRQPPAFLSVFSVLCNCAPTATFTLTPKPGSLSARPLLQR
jgi:hypothetical protein